MSQADQSFTTRRAILTGAAAATTAVVVGGSTLAQTPIEKMAVRLKALQSREARASKAWDSAYAEVSGSARQGARLMSAEDELDAILDQRFEVERAILDAPAQGRGDYQIKLSIYRGHIERDLDGAPEGLADMVEQLLHH